MNEVTGCDYPRDFPGPYLPGDEITAIEPRMVTSILEVPIEAYQQALAIQKKLAADHPEAAEYRRALATTQNGLGSLYTRAGQHEKAQASLEQALAIWSQLVGN